jgi:hypothetical protein
MGFNRSEAFFFLSDPLLQIFNVCLLGLKCLGGEFFRSHHLRIPLSLFFFFLFEIIYGIFGAAVELGILMAHEGRQF